MRKKIPTGFQKKGSILISKLCIKRNEIYIMIELNSNRLQSVLK